MLNLLKQQTIIIFFQCLSSFQTLFKPHRFQTNVKTLLQNSLFSYSTKWKLLNVVWTVFTVKINLFISFLFSFAQLFLLMFHLLRLFQALKTLTYFFFINIHHNLCFPRQWLFAKVLLHHSVAYNTEKSIFISISRFAWITINCFDHYITNLSLNLSS